MPWCKKSRLIKKILINNKFSLGDYNVDFLNNKPLFSKDRKTNIAKEKSIISGILFNSITLNKKRNTLKISHLDGEIIFILIKKKKLKLIIKKY